MAEIFDDTKTNSEYSSSNNNSDPIYWQIGEFHKLVPNRGLTTVDNWFKHLEENKVHYIGREVDTGQKIYNELDRDILIYIDKRRKENIPIKVITDELVGKFELRPFPPGENKTDNTRVLDLEAIQKRFQDTIRESYQESLTEIKSEIGDLLTHYFKENLKPLIETNDTIKLRIEEDLKHYEERINDERKLAEERRMLENLKARKVGSLLRTKALKEWANKPASERMVKTGFFSKSEDINKRDIFVEEYINKHYDEEYKKNID
ncbi:hypothetical protein [Bacillus infantis]|uniref:hypothetical protein n=1 Tax=Bacillus infantis TaxID=324767 RepID=UPI00209D922E|nr:hypothetical protein [Bacillus infantis]MCP1161425.1 hypothetical protein [Bacillus infantis]